MASHRTEKKENILTRKRHTHTHKVNGYVLFPLYTAREIKDKHFLLFLFNVVVMNSVQ